MPTDKKEILKIAFNKQALLTEEEWAEMRSRY